MPPRRGHNKASTSIRHVTCATKYDSYCLFCIASIWFFLDLLSEWCHTGAAYSSTCLITACQIKVQQLSVRDTSSRRRRPTSICLCWRQTALFTSKQFEAVIVTLHRVSFDNMTSLSVTSSLLTCCWNDKTYFLFPFVMDSCISTVLQSPLFYSVAFLQAAV